MKSWLCNCSRLNPDSEHRCLSCKTLRPDFKPKKLQPLNPNFMEKDNIENKVKQIKEEFTISQLRLDAMMYVDAIVNCLSPAKETMRCVSILTVTKDEVWMKTECGNACLVFNGKEWARIISRIVTKKTIQGILHLMKTGNPPAGNLEEKQKIKTMKKTKLDYKKEDGLIYDIEKLSKNDQELISEYIGKNVLCDFDWGVKKPVKITGFHCIGPKEIIMKYKDFVLIEGLVPICDLETETWVETTEDDAQCASKKLNPDELIKKIKNDFTDAGLLLDMMRMKVPNGIHMIAIDEFGTIQNYASANTKGVVHIKKDQEFSHVIVFNDAIHQLNQINGEIIKLNDEINELRTKKTEDKFEIIEKPKIAEDKLLAPVFTVSASNNSVEEKSKYVKAELLERALTMWLHQREEKFKNQDVKDHLTDVFGDVFPEISFQQVGDKIILL